MNENLDLVEILKDVPMGIRLYSPLFGEVELVDIDYDKDIDYPITVKLINSMEDSLSEPDSFAANGIYHKGYIGSECLLFPSKDQRDWSKFKALIPDKALVWCWDNHWICGTELRFYDAKNKTTFKISDGDRAGFKFDNYELYKGEYPDWAKEAQKKLED